MSRFVLYITSMPIGYLGSVACFLRESGHEVHCIVKSLDIGILLREKFSLAESSITVRSYEYTGSDAIKDSMYYEKKYGEKFAMLCSYDRGLGKGYIQNADSHPDQRKSYWSKDKKYIEILAQIEFFDEYLTKIKPHVVVGYAQSKTLAIVSRGLNIPYRMLLPPRWKSYYSWAENEYDENSLMISFLKQKCLELRDTDLSEKAEVNDLVFAKYFMSKVRISAVDTLKDVVRHAINDTKRAIRTSFKSDGYRYLGWTRFFLNRYQGYRFIEKVGVSVGDLGKGSYVLFPLQTEPESSLLYGSPESNNSAELITWLSKNLPADMFLVVKEHPLSFGVRSVRYYKRLLKMPNVVFASHAASSADWIEQAACVATITGTMGFEAINHLRPVLSFGRHQLINHLPTVKYADSFDSTRVALKELLQITKDQPMLSMAKLALITTIEQFCFKLDGFEAILKSRDSAQHLAELSMGNFFRMYPAFSRV